MANWVVYALGSQCKTGMPLLWKASDALGRLCRGGPLWDANVKLGGLCSGRPVTNWATYALEGQWRTGSSMLWGVNVKLRRLCSGKPERASGATREGN